MKKKLVYSIYKKFLSINSINLKIKSIAIYYTNTYTTNLYHIFCPSIVKKIIERKKVQLGHPEDKSISKLYNMQSKQIDLTNMQLLYTQKRNELNFMEVNLLQKKRKIILHFTEKS
uniref:Uncharacterized protein n=2 Tax=Cacopsylla melanoneura TaxID=428564 RepID=A0A8D8M5Q7_9HEMI